jgi:D-alanine-D-alanine ligase
MEQMVLPPRAKVVVVGVDPLDHIPERADSAAWAGEMTQQVVASLEALGCDVVARSTRCNHSAIHEVVDELRATKPALVFNLWASMLTGDWSHEVVLPALFDLAGVRYTGSNGLAIGLTQHKDLTAKILSASSVPSPPAVLIREGAPLEVSLPFPLIVKPHREHGSVGITPDSVVSDRDALEARVRWLHATFQQPALVERFINGREVVVSIVGTPPVALALCEVDFRHLPAGMPAIFSYDSKWSDAPEYHLPVRPADDIPEAIRRRCAHVAVEAFTQLGLCDYGRIDLRLDEDGTPYVIDVNANCALDYQSIMATAATASGIAHPKLIESICTSALRRYASHARASGTSVTTPA